MTVLQAKTALMAYGFDTGDPLNTWLEAGKLEVEDAYDWPFLQSLTTGSTAVNSNTFTPATTPTKVLWIQMVASGKKLEPVEYTAYVRQNNNILAVGEPDIYTIYGAEPISIQLWPKADAVYTMTLGIETALLDINGLSDGSPMPGPARMHFTMVRAAAAIALQADNEEERALTAMQAFDADLAKKIRRYNVRDLDEAKTVTNVMEY